jgi:hypothetical protein
MLVSTVLNLFVVPVLYVLIISLEERLRPRHGKHGSNGRGTLADPVATPTITGV